MKTKDGGRSGPTIKMSEKAAHRVRVRFEDLAAEFDNVARALGREHRAATSAVGQFAHDFTDTDTFLLSWHGDFEVCSRAAALIAGNTNAMYLDLNALDRSASTTITI